MNDDEKQMAYDGADVPEVIPAEVDGVEMEFDNTVYHKVKFIPVRKTLKGKICKKHKNSFFTTTKMVMGNLKNLEKKLPIWKFEESFKGYRENKGCHI